MKRNTPLKRSPLRPKPRDPAKEAGSKAKARKRARDRYEKDFGGAHADWVRERGCEVARCVHPAQFHHEPARGMGGSKKSTAHRGVGLCAWHHEDSPMARHRVGRERFDAEHGTNLLGAAARNWRESPYGEAAHGE